MWSLAGLEAGCRICLARREGAAAGFGLVAAGGAGISCLVYLGGQAVVRLGVPETGLACGAGLVGAVGAQLGAVACVVGGDVQRDHDGLDVAVGDHDLVLGGLAAGFGMGGQG